MLISIVIAAVLGFLLDQMTGQQTVIVSMMTGMFLGLLSVSGPFFLSLRMVLMVGALMVLTCGMAVVGAQNAFVAVLGMVLVVFIATLWRAIPLLGQLLGAFPTILYLLILARYQTFTGGADAWHVMLGVLPGIAAALIVLVAFNGWDPRKATRRAAAGSWGDDISWSQLGTVIALLRFDNAPRSLLAVVQSGILAMVARTWLKPQQEQPPFTSGLAGDHAIAGALIPRGAIVPRTVGPAVPQAMTDLSAAGSAAQSTHEKYAWNRWHAALDYASSVLAGTRTANSLAFTNRSVSDILLRSVLHPQSASFRYGVQKALALGAATFILVNSDLPNFYWVLLAIFSVMQANVTATFNRSLQYAVGTWVGAVAAVALSLVLPPLVLGLLGGVFLIAGFAWMVRNYMVMCVAVAASVVLLTGAPDGQYVNWAALRALDVTVGVLVALAVSTFVFRVRAQPTEHVADAQRALLAAVSQLRDRLEDPQHSGRSSLTAESSFLLATANLEADMQLLKNAGPVAAQLAELQDCNSHVLALASVIFGGTGSPLDEEPEKLAALLQHSLEQLDARIRAIEP